MVIIRKGDGYKKIKYKMNYNNIIKYFGDIATSHPFINRFGSGDISDIDSISDDYSLFPILWVVPQSVNIGENTLVYKFRFMVFDIDNTDDRHQQEILSDTLSTFLDVVKTFVNIDPEVDIEYDNEAIPFTERFTDYLVGWYGDLSIITQLDNNPCNIAE